ncbi:unnamed protein product [Rhizoctonia solani]|uniref:WAP domain-containing protein n=1 Tax=Rhizoctonia solani TaxID=456999 RepID=A0A8H3AF65_9AGAM|nr:unnamed protein product [Rhizoctonia solani]CAE6498455.1 unnamed protein product [Rhizoctonia solani]
MKLFTVVAVLVAVISSVLATPAKPPGYHKPTPTKPCSTPTPTCNAQGQPCDLGNPGACCSQTCLNLNPPAPPVCA